MIFSNFKTTFLTLAVLFLSVTAPVWGGQLDKELEDLGFIAPEESVVGITRSPRPISQIAENVTVVTADQIALLNAHTLADVLQTIPGIQLDHVRTPGSFSFFNIHGALNTHVLLLVDGVPQNDLLSSQADAGLIPVQNIERVEIIKGSASAAWGQALGGVVNVITKSPDLKTVAGMVSSSMGERFTADSRGEVSGTANRFGYYLSAGNLHSHGLLPNNGTNRNSAYAKFIYDLPGKGSITIGGDIQDAFRGMDETELYHDDNYFNHGYSFLNITQPLTDHFNVEVLGRYTRKHDVTVWGSFGDAGQVIRDTDIHLRESTQGIGAKITWADGGHRIVSGVEYEHGEVEQKDELVAGTPPIVDRNLEKWGSYLNGSISAGPFTILPGVRFDHTGIGSDVLSATIGTTYRLAEKTVLRGYGARGYSLPNVTFNDKPQKIWTLQVGVETEEVPYLWLKGTIFYNRLSDIADNYSGELRDVIKQGAEIEARTVAVYGFSLAGGYTFIDARDRDTNARLKTGSDGSNPIHSGKISLTYDSPIYGLRGIITGNYVLWNAVPEMNAHNGMIWDLHLTQKLLPLNELSPEIFFSARNLFNDLQTADGNLFNNTGRWLEGGVRFKF